MKQPFCLRTLSILAILILLTTFSFAQKTGLVLSGGGARGMAHIGALKALEENGILVDYVAGTSAGALVGALYATGLSPVQIESLVLSGEFKDWATGNINEDLDYYFNKPESDASWISLKFSIDSVLRTHLPLSVVNSARSDFALMEGMSSAIAKANYNFDSLFVPFRCVSADITSRRQIIFKEGDLPMAVRASMAYPLYFTPVTIDNMILFDGGIYNNFPVDVMANDFNPDIIIGVNAGSFPDVPYEENLLSMFKTMIVQTTTYAVPREDDVLITPSFSNIGVFDFDEMRSAIDSGYFATLKEIERIKSKNPRIYTQEEIAQKRNDFRSGLTPPTIDQITATGVKVHQEEYIKKILNNRNECMEISDLKPAYFKLITDNNIKSAFPRLKFNPATGYYDLNLLVRKENDLRVDFGGNISSSPINEAYVGFQYSLLRRNSLTTNANIYFGKLYNSVSIKLRFDVKGDIVYYIEPVLTINRFDYFKSSSFFLEDIKPAYLIQTDRFYGGNVGIPARNKGKVYVSGGYFKLVNSYYQTRDFSSEDIADNTDFYGLTGSINFERNTLNKKMYAREGTFFNITGKLVSGKEETTPGTTGLFNDTISKYHSWMQLKMTYDNYFKSLGRFTFGLYTELFFSNQPFFGNYTATMLTTQAYQPIPQSKTLFLDNYRAHNYIGMGLKSVISIVSNIELRIEGHMFQPFQEIIQNEDRKAEYRNAFETRSGLASMAAVYHSPVGPVSLSVNYYEKRENSFSVLFHFGYIIFNRRALD